jgi:hypothetical protein
MPTTAHQAPPGMSGEGPDALYSKGGDERSARTGRRPTLMQAKSAGKIPHDQHPQRWEETDHLAHHMRKERGNYRNPKHSEITIKPM